MRAGPDIDNAERFPVLSAPARDASGRLSLLDPSLRARIRDALDVERHDEGDIALTSVTRPRPSATARRHQRDARAVTTEHRRKPRARR
jgi:hypothetical protein